MEKYIEEVIEIVLDNVSCEHQISGEYTRGMRVADVTYCLDNEQEVIKKCLAAFSRRLEVRPKINLKGD